MEFFWQDLRYGFRTLLQNPAFAAVAVLSLALSMGANTAIFSVMDAMLFKMLPVKNPEQLVQSRAPISYSTFQKISARNEIFSGMSVNWVSYQASVRISEEGEQSIALMVSGNYCSVLGIHPAAGRCLTPEDDSIPSIGGPQGSVGMISYQYWQRRFALDPAVLGRRITLNGAPLTIVGVTPQHFFGLDPTLSPDVTVPFTLQPVIENSPISELWTHGDNGSILSYDASDDYGPVFVARLHPGVSLAQANAQINVLYQQILAARSGGQIDERQRRENSQKKIELVEAGNGYESWDAQQKSLFLIAMAGAPALVLLIACANVANLLLARAAARQNEVAVRIAIGAGRSRLVRQFLTESLLLALAGGLLALLFANWFRRIVLLVISSMLSASPFYTPAETDSRVLLYTAGTCLLAIFLFGLAPALRASSTELACSLREGARGLSGGRGWQTSKLLVAAQVALSLFLLVGAGLLVRSLQNLRSFDPGFSRQNLYVGFTYFPGYKGIESGAVLKHIWNRVAALPGARAVGMASRLPAYNNRLFNISVEGYTPTSGSEQLSAERLLAGPGFFQALGIPLLSGRVIEARDDENAPKVCVVSAEFARVFFPNQNPIGRHFTLERPGARLTSEIVGVVRDVYRMEANRRIWRGAFCPILQDLPISATLILLRTSGDPSVPIAELRRQLELIDKNMFLDITSVQSFEDGDRFSQRLSATLATAYSLLALLLASVGLYGVMGYSVSRRTREIGIRVALGAGRSAVVRMVLRETMSLVAIGIAVGLAAALITMRFVTTSLFGVMPTDPLTICFAIAVISIVALIAGYIPARRAAAVDPIIALHHD